jgi:hypothetical protein
VSAEHAPHSTLTYYRCTGCGQASSDVDPVAFRRAVRRVEVAGAGAGAGEELTEQVMTEWCRRLEAFQIHASETDPFSRLGLSPNATLEQARERFHTLAMEHHPDRGGDAQALSEIIEAFDRVRDRLARGQSTHRLRPTTGKPVLQRRRPESWSRVPLAKP